MKVNSSQFLDQLKEEALKIIEQGEQLRQLSVETLSLKPNEEAWNVLECLEHMNMYHKYYLPEIKKQISTAKYPAEAIFKAGWFGNYSAQNMLPKKVGKINMPMNTFKDMNPIGQALKIDVLEQFISQMKEFLVLIESARKVNLRRTKIKLTIRFLKFTLGDTLHFVINHNKRHLIQVQKTLSLTKV